MTSRPPATGRRLPPLWSLPALWTVALGLWELSRQESVWRDEAATWQVALRSPGEIGHLLGQVDAAHGLYYLSMHGVFAVFGPGVSALRLPSVLAVAVAASCVTVIGRRLGGNIAGLGAGTALALLPAVQFHLQEGRPYALVLAGAAISTLMLVTLLLDPSGASAPRWVAYGVTILATALLNWLSLTILLAHAVTLTWAGARRSVRIRWALTAAVAGAGALPLVLLSLGQSAQVSWIPALTWHTLIGPAVLSAIGGLGALLERPRGRRLSVTAVGLPLLVVPLLTLALLSLIRPLFVDRYVLFAMLGLALLIGAALEAAVRAARPRFPRAARWVLPVAVVLAWSALLPHSLATRSPASRVDDVLAAAADVDRLASPGDAVLFVPAARRDTKSVSPGAFTGLRDIALARDPVESGTLKGVEESPDRIRREMLTRRRILLVTDAPEAARPHSAERDRVKTDTLRRYFTPVADERARGRRVIVYERGEG
ncbi:hypothetical protein AAH978_16610 [Streptomyces sp. ZYX-F-203]